MFVKLVIPIILIIGFLAGIRLMQSPRTAFLGNRLGALCMILAIGFAFSELGIKDSLVWVYIFFGGIAGIFLGQTVKMIQMPQTVALLNGLGGGASAFVAGIAMGIDGASGSWLFWFTAALALGIGTLTFSGSIVAALKLHGLISGKPVIIKGHSFVNSFLLLLGVVLCISILFIHDSYYRYIIIFVFALYGVFMSLRIGGADMPVIISLLNSLSGVAAAVNGLAVDNILLTGVGSVVGVAGMILTQIMCRAMNRNLLAVLSGFKSKVFSTNESADTEVEAGSSAAGDNGKVSAENIPFYLQDAKKVIFVPGYGMALAQAQQEVKVLFDILEKYGKEVKVAIHPVAGRMPGHMNVLLAEVGFDYEKLLDMDSINPEFEETDIVIVVGACDVINPAATTAVGTPIYGMPVLNVSKAKLIIVCNLNEKPGYSGVENLLYSQENVVTLWGDAAQTVSKIRESYQQYVSTL